MGLERKILIKGIKYLSGALPLFFMGPIVINSAFKNKQHGMYEVVLILGIVLCALSVYFTFKGIKTIVNGMFDGDK